MWSHYKHMFEYLCVSKQQPSSLSVHLHVYLLQLSFMTDLAPVLPALDVNSRTWVKRLII